MGAGDELSEQERLIADQQQCYWYLHGKAYDFTKFMATHPGGWRALLLGRGRDCTELFYSYHTNLPSQSLLDKYEVQGVKIPVPIAQRSNIVKYTFDDKGFYMTLKRRAQEYFKSNNIPHTKAPFLYSCGVYTWIFINLMLMYATLAHGSLVAGVLLGITRSLLIIRDTHAVSHFALTRNQTENHILYCITMILSGTTPTQWTAKHVIAHHVETNVVPVDDDTMYPMKRVLVALPRLAYHRYQHIYMWLMYFVTLPLWTASNFVKLLINYRYEGVTHVDYPVVLDAIEPYVVLGSHILLYYVLPFVLYSFGYGLALVLSTATLGSLWFVLQFVVNHEVEESAVSVIKPASPIDWGHHQVITSHNYSVDEQLALQLSGGLNLQIEHHLFPSVHFSHYYALSKITQQTCKEFNIPYNHSATFIEGLHRHQDWLRKMGTYDVPPTH